MKPATYRCSLMLACLISAAHAGVSPGFAQDTAMVTSSPGASTADAGGLTYADIVDLAEQAPLVAHVRIRNSIALKPDRATGVRQGHRRVYIEAETLGLIRGEGGISPSVTYLYDAPLDGRGKLPKLKKDEVIIFARAGEKPGEVQLVTPDAQLSATPEAVARIRTILSALVAPDAPPRILGPGEAFHVAGTIAGEGETQIFLRTETGDPVSLSILRRPGQAPRWAVALGEIVDEAARPPEEGSLLWYRLACGLPPVLPPQSVRTLSPPDAQAARADYQLVIAALGSCRRNRSVG